MIFYTYLWLREDGTPYYVGKGSGQRAFTNEGHNVRRPEDLERIIVQEYPNETEALEAERLLIAVYGRKLNKTGILRNLTEGGEGTSGFVFSAEQRKRLGQAMSKALKGKTFPHMIKPKSELCKARMRDAKQGYKPVKTGCNIIWTPERRALQRERAKAQGFGGR